MEAVHEAIRLHNTSKPMQEWLDLKVFFNLMETRRGSRAATASALSAWHEFAVGFLEYEEAKSLPPRQENDVVQFVALFNHGFSAQQYVGSVAWGCKVLYLQTVWKGEVLALALKGSKKATTRSLAGTLDLRVTLTEG